MIADFDDICNLCRLCLTSHHKNFDSKNNIFTQEMDGAKNTRTSLQTILRKLFQIEYKQHPQLPQAMCQQCFLMVQKFYSFQQNVQKCERVLRDRFLYYTSNQAGLNGNPGVFEPSEDCVIMEIDPNQHFDSSEDEFSMESDQDVAGIIYSAKSVQSGAFLSRATDVNLQKSLNSLECKSAESKMESTSILIKATSSDTGQDYSQINRTAYMCQYCDAAFAAQTDCLQHEKNHDVNIPYVCHYCSLKYMNRQTLIVHIREVHDSERPYVCTVCTKAFGRRADLKKHSIVHTGIRPYECPICFKDFSRNTNLTKHMRIHDNRKPYSCRHCSRIFNTGIELLRHSRCHNTTSSALKPFKSKAINNRVHICDICNKVFTREMDLQRHQALHLDMLFKCTQCGIGFNRREKLIRHQIEHHTSKFQCDTCHITFSTLGERDQHMRIHGLLNLNANIFQSFVTNAGDNPITEKQKNIQEIQSDGNSYPQPSSLTSPTWQSDLLSTCTVDLYQRDVMPAINLGFYSETNPENRNYI